jgi:hypothetical protein
MVSCLLKPISTESSQIGLLSGKSTQLPSFILEDHLSRGLPCKIYVTEPRRISAISLAERVSKELGDMGVSSSEQGGLVGYSIRLESKIGRNTVRANPDDIKPAALMVFLAPCLCYQWYSIADAGRECWVRRPGWFIRRGHGTSARALTVIGS